MSEKRNTTGVSTNWGMKETVKRIGIKLETRHPTLGLY